MIINIVCEADQERLLELVKPLSLNRCIMIRMYVSAANKATTDKTLKVAKTEQSRGRLWEKYHTKI